MIFLWSLLTTESALLYGFELLYGIGGIALGVFYGAIFARWILGQIDKKGEFKNTPEVIIYIIFVILILGPIIFYFVPFTGLTQLSSFAYPFVLSTYVTRASLFLSWEKEQGKHIATAGLWAMKSIPAK